jgi:3-methyladenine DNA glycosylase AlkD
MVRGELRAIATPERAKANAWFFKTGKGEYGEGDQFVGVRVPDQRKIARDYRQLPLEEIRKLIDSAIHEERLTGTFILVSRYQEGDAATKEQCFDFYLKHLSRMNNWDIVDSSAPHIVGTHLKTRKRDLLYRLAKSKVLWERRVAMVSTQALIASGEHQDAFAIAKLLFDDEEDLMHKAVGWMLREVGKHVDPDLLRGFLKKNVKKMPRTALRYAIEHFPRAERKQWLAA